MIVKQFLVIIILFEAVSVDAVQGNEDKATFTETFTIKNVWRNHRNNSKEKEERVCCKCNCEPDWLGGVEEYFNGTLEAAKKFPPGKPIQLADAVMTTFQNFLTKIIEFSTNSNSTVLSSGSAAILEALSKLSKLASSPNTIIEEFDKALPNLVEAYSQVVSSLSKIIGELACYVNSDVSDLECALRQYISEFSQEDEHGNRKEVDFSPVMKRLRKLANTVSLMAATTLSKCELATPDVQDAMTVLSLIVDHLSICVQGINACSQAILSEQKCQIPVVLRISFAAMDIFTTGITRSVASITFPVEGSATALFRNIVNLTKGLNVALKNILGLFEGVTLTAAQITQNLSKGISSTANGLRNLLSGIVAMKF